MEITLKLFASLRDYHPGAHEIRVAVEEGTCPAAVMEHFGLPREKVHLVLVNGSYVQPQDIDTTPLRDGDVLALWPPIAGG